MAITVGQFRYDYPEFSSTTVYPASQIQYWLDIAYSLLDPNRWGLQLSLGIELYVAHNVSLEARSQVEAANNGIPGQQSGLVASKQVGPISMKYDTTHSVERGAGHWNLTIYGTRFARLVKLFGSGPVQLGIGYVQSYSGLGWNGPLATPGFSNFL